MVTSPKQQVNNAVMAFSLPVILLLGFAAVWSAGTNGLLFVFLNHWLHVLPDWFWANVTFMADASAMGALGAILLLRRERLVLAMLVGGLICALIIRALKLGFDSPRPPAVMNGSLFELIGAGFKKHSFPSGHAATAFFFAGALLGYKPNAKMYVLVLAGAIVAALSRIAVGVHWPVDILVGGAIGWPIGFLSARYFARREYFNYAKRWLVFVAGYLASLLLLFYNSELPYVAPLQMALAVAGLFCCMYYISFRILKV
ncbi:MAG: phosphatase PAP2 family protein [Oceanospirillaceae bacterium]|nr:phosphatase PAP2 family protein [Oceanospirillaceae bacterium]